MVASTSAFVRQPGDFSLTHALRKVSSATPLGFIVYSFVLLVAHYGVAIKYVVANESVVPLLEDPIVLRAGTPVVSVNAGLIPLTDAAPPDPHNDVSDLAFSVDGSVLACAGAHWKRTIDEPLGEITLWDLQTRRIRRVIRPDDIKMVAAVSFFPDGKRLASLDYLSCDGASGVVHFWDVVSGRQVRETRWSEQRLKCLAVSGNRLWLAIGCLHNNRSVRILSLRANEHRAFLQCGVSGVSALRFSADSQFLISSSPDRVVRLWDVTTWSKRGGFSVEGKPYYCALAVSPAPDHPVLAISAGKTGTDISVRQFPGCKEVASLKGHTQPVYCLAFSPDARLLASGAIDVGPAPAGMHQHADRCSDSDANSDKLDGTVELKLWKWHTGEVVASAPGHMHAVTQVAFSPCGNLLASADGTGAIRLWNIGTSYGGREKRRKVE